MLAPEKQQGLVDITLDRDGIKLFFNSSSFYSSGEANLLPLGQSIIDKVTQAMNTLDFYKFGVDVEGIRIMYQSIHLLILLTGSFPLPVLQEW